MTQSRRAFLTALATAGAALVVPGAAAGAPAARPGTPDVTLNLPAGPSPGHFYTVRPGDQIRHVPPAIEVRVVVEDGADLQAAYDHAAELAPGGVQLVLEPGAYGDLTMHSDVEVIAHEARIGNIEVASGSISLRDCGQIRVTTGSFVKLPPFRPSG